MSNLHKLLKLLLSMNVLNEFTTAPFSVSFSQLPAVKVNTENGAALMLLRTFIQSNDFSVIVSAYAQLDLLAPVLCFLWFIT